ncbi:actin-related protein (ARP1) [Plasmodium ovale curtisi]|uniref:Actin-related protein (ARP1) n=1 Tax=Plasmodium ovale curtisi TaxID=864141 RepID=A0A1A8WVT9_PLAOA|nr:actin-related protein (ARP1) [Plasmodium ovale curtisi]SBS95438.1 actin-related protein (ARP1) [Plasmodium ovale curtisi]
MFLPVSLISKRKEKLNVPRNSHLLLKEKRKGLQKEGCILPLLTEHHSGRSIIDCGSSAYRHNCTRKQRDRQILTNNRKTNNSSERSAECDKCCRITLPRGKGRSDDALPKYKRVMAGAVEGDIFVGNKAEEYRGLLKVSYPINHGIIENWNDMENIWIHVYNSLKINAEEHPVLLTEAPLNPQKNKEKIAEVFFESFNVPALFISIQAILSLYSCGKTNGTVLDCGDGVCHCVSIYEGKIETTSGTLCESETRYSITNTITRTDVAGRDITTYLSYLLRKNGHLFNTSAEMEVVKNMKENCCYVSFNMSKEKNSAEKALTTLPYILPDGSQILIGSERYRAPEVLFNPSILGLEYLGLSELIVTSITRADMDLRKTLYSHIVLSGGTTLFHGNPPPTIVWKSNKASMTMLLLTPICSSPVLRPKCAYPVSAGFGDRLLNEIRKFAPKDITIRISAPPERKFSTFIGGSILASLATFKKIWITKQEFDEYGSVILHRKTF